MTVKAISIKLKIPCIKLISVVLLLVSIHSMNVSLFMWYNKIPFSRERERKRPKKFTDACGDGYVGMVLCYH